MLSPTQTSVKSRPLPTSFHPSHTDLSKYTIARLAQLVDPNETITYRAPAINACIALEELRALLGEQSSRKHSRDTNRTPPSVPDAAKDKQDAPHIRTLLNEMLDKDIPCSVVNDPVVQAIRTTLPARLKGYLTMVLGDAEVRSGIVHDVDRIWRDLTDEYYKTSIDLLGQIDWRSKHFDTEAKTIERLLECIASQLIHRGYSLRFFEDVVSEMARLEVDAYLTPLSILVEVQSDTSYLVAFNGKASKDEVNLLKALDAKRLRWKNEDGKTKYFRTFTAEGRDPTAAVSAALRRAFRHHHVRQNGIPSRTLEIFSEKLMWGEKAGGPVYHQRDNLAGDPRFVRYRSNTVSRILDASDSSISTLDDHVVKCVEDALYLYNQALFAPSLENSYILLWTALEVMSEFKQNTSVLRNVAALVSAAAGLGAFGRRVYSLARLCDHYGLRSAFGSSLNQIQASEDSLSAWAEVLCAEVSGPDDPYETLRQSPLCSYQYIRLQVQYKSVEDIQRRMRKSRKSAEMQVERLYIARNAMVHGGRFDEHSEDLWIHLECYVGTLIASAIGYAQVMLQDNETSSPIESSKGFWKGLGACLEAQYRQVLEGNSNLSCCTVDWRELGCFSWPEVCL